MDIIRKLALAGENPNENQAPTIAFLGDSVTHGVFEISETGYTFDFDNVYHAQLRRMLTGICPNATVNIINAGVNGGGAPRGAERLERDVLSHKPDLTVVCFGLNDVHGGPDGVERYVIALRDIFTRLKAAGSEVIFMTPNMMNEYYAPETVQKFKKAAEDCIKYQTDGTMDEYMNAARRLCAEMGVALCDCYDRWQAMKQAGIDTTALLANHINHPSRVMHGMFAGMLLDTMLMH